MSETVELPTDPDGRAGRLEEVAERLRDGALAVVPTDTCYGLAADAFSLDGTARLFAAKGQDRRAPLTVFLRSPKQLLGLVPEVPEVAERLVAAFWPGPLTLVLPAETGLRWDLGRADGTVAVRMPLDDVALELVRAVGPLAVSSAGLAGGPPPATVDEARAALGDAVAVYLEDGRRPATPLSTIVALVGATPTVLRPGAIPDALVVGVATGELDPFEAAATLLAGDTAAAVDDAGPDAERDGFDREG